MAVSARLKSQAGFSIIEMLVVLAISAMTMGLIFTIGVRTGQNGLRMGQRALHIADQQLAGDTYRSLIDSLIVPPITTRAMTEGGTEDATIDTAFRGEASEVSAPWLAQRASICGQAGATGRLTLAIAQENGTTFLTCQVDDGAQLKMVDLKFTAAHFVYSEDGQNWVDTWTVEAGQPIADSLTPSAELRKIYVRIATDDGVADLTEMASSGRAINQPQAL